MLKQVEILCILEINSGFVHIYILNGLRRKNMARIVIDPGHGGRDFGATFNGRKEKDDNLRLALAVGNILKNNGYDVVYTRQSDVYDTPTEKANKANAANADFFVSFHRNKSVNPGQYDGVQTLVYGGNPAARRLAEKINSNLETLGFKNIGVEERPDLAVLRRTKMPAVLIETGFIDNEKDNRIYDEDFQKVAQQIADAIMAEVPKTANTSYYVQTGLFKNSSNANRLYAQLQSRGYPAVIDRYNNYIRVKVGPYSTLSAASAKERELRRDGFSTLIIQE